MILNPRHPDAFLIGMQRSGTTFLRSYFEAHPDISWSRNAAHFMKADGWDDKDGYLRSLKPENSQAKIYIDAFESLAVSFLHKQMDIWRSKSLVPGGSIDPGVIPAISEIPDRIHSLFPSAKIILIIRNQIDWFASNYLHFVLGIPQGKRKFTDFLTTPEGKLLLNAGFYSNVILAYQRAFGVDRVHVLLLEQIERDPEATLSRLCQFLGVDYFPFPETLQKRNAGAPQGQRRLQALLARAGVKKTWLPKLSFVKPFIPKLNNASRSPLTEQEKILISSMYAIENMRLAKLLGVDLASYNYK